MARKDFKIGDRVYHKNYEYGNIIDILFYSHYVMFDTIGKRIVPTHELKIVAKREITIIDEEQGGNKTL